MILVIIAGCAQVSVPKEVKVPECDNIDSSWDRDVCYNNLAIKSRDSQICLKIKTIDYRNNCLSSTGQIIPEENSTLKKL